MLLPKFVRRAEEVPGRGWGGTRLWPEAAGARWRRHSPPHGRISDRTLPVCRSAIILQMATSDPIPLGPVAKCRQVRSLRGVHWDNAHQYNINDNSPILNLASGSIIPRASAQKRVYVIEIVKSWRVRRMHSQRCMHPKPQGAAWQHEWQHHANQNNHASFIHLSRGHY